MGGEHQTGHLSNEDQKLDSLRPGSREVERGRREGQNFQLGSSAPGRRRREDDGWNYYPKHVDQFTEI